MTLYYPPLAEATLDTTGVLLAEANGNRKKILIQAAAANTALVKVYLLAAGAVVIGTESFLELDAGGLYEPDLDATPSNAIWVKSASGSQTIRWLEA